MKFIAIIILVVGGIYSYINHQLLNPLEFTTFQYVMASILLSVPFVFLALQPIYFWSREHRNDSGGFYVFQKIIHFDVSYLNYLIFTVIFRDLFHLVSQSLEINLFNYDLKETVIILFIPVLLFGLGNLVVFFGPNVLYRKFSPKKLGKEWQNFRIVQISDLHLGASNTKKFVKRTVDRVNALNADVLVFTGDLFDGTERGMRPQFEILKNIKAKNLLFCSGNHEYYWSYEKLAILLDEMNMFWLNNSQFEIKKDGETKIAFFGIPDPQAKSFGHDGPDWQKLENLFDKNEYRILLAHQPYLFDEASKRGFDLQLSGHTHGGQFFPWNFFIKFIQKYSKGFYQKGDSLLYVNQGTAWWGPADRLGTCCEITCFDIEV